MSLKGFDEKEGYKPDLVDLFLLDKYKMKIMGLRDDSDEQPTQKTGLKLDSDAPILLNPIY